MLTREELPECPVATTVQLIGNKWKLLIIRNLNFNDKQRFTDFLKSIIVTRAHKKQCARYHTYCGKSFTFSSHRFVPLNYRLFL